MENPEGITKLLHFPYNFFPSAFSQHGVMEIQFSCTQLLMTVF